MASWPRPAIALTSPDTREFGSPYRVRFAPFFILCAPNGQREFWPVLLNRFRPFNRTGWPFFDVFLPWKRLVVRLDAARNIDGKRKRILTASNIVLHPNIGDPARLFVTNKIQTSIYPIHRKAILLAVGAIYERDIGQKERLQLRGQV